MTISTQPTPTTRADATPDRARPGAGRLVGYGAGTVAALGLAALILLSGPASYEPGGGDQSAYSRPTNALDGQSLAAYIAAHQATRLPGDPI